MDENGVDFMVISLNALGVQRVADQAKAEALVRLDNDRLEAEVMKNPTR